MITNINQTIAKEHGKKKTKDTKESEEIKSALLNIESDAIRFSLSRYMDTCRNIQRENQDALREKKLSGNVTGMEAVLLNSFGSTNQQDDD